MKKVYATPYFFCLYIHVLWKKVPVGGLYTCNRSVIIPTMFTFFCSDISLLLITFLMFILVCSEQFQQTGSYPACNEQGILGQFG